MDLTLEEKASLCLGSDFWRTAPVPRAGIRAITLSDGPHGLRKQPQPKEHFLPATARRHKPAPEPVERAPRRFRVTDVVSRRTLGDDLDARATLDVLAGQRSSVDVNVSVWEPGEDRWRLLTLAEKQLLWDRRR